MQKPQPTRASIQQEVSDMCAGGLITLPSSNKQNTTVNQRSDADRAQQLQLTDRQSK